MANVHQCLPNQDHQRACSRHRFLSPSPGDSGPRGLVLCFLTITSNQINNHSIVRSFSGEVSRKENLPDTPHSVGSAGVHVLVCRLASAHRACTHVWCAFLVSLLLSLMGTITSKADGKVPKRNFEETW